MRVSLDKFFEKFFVRVNYKRLGIQFREGLGVSHCRVSFTVRIFFFLLFSLSFLYELILFHYMLSGTPE